MIYIVWIKSFRCARQCVSFMHVQSYISMQLRSYSALVDLVNKNSLEAVKKGHNQVK